eukprot:629874_1
MSSSQSLLLRNSKGQFRKGHAPITANPSAPKQRKKKRKLDLTPTLKHLHLSEHDVGVRRSQRIKHQTQRKKKPKLDLTPSKYFRSKNDVPVLRRSQRIKCQKQEAKSLKKTKCIKRRKRKRQKSSLSSISKHNNSSQPMDGSSQSNYHKKVKETLSNAKLIKYEYKCVQCNQRFPIDVKHYCSHDPLTIEHFVCFDSECDFKFDCFDAFKEHMNKCHRLFRNLYKCPHCSKRYDAKCQLKNHENDHLNNARFECCLCKQRFTMLFKLRGHQCVGMDPQLHGYDWKGRALYKGANGIYYETSGGNKSDIIEQKERKYYHGTQGGIYYETAAGNRVYLKPEEVKEMDEEQKHKEMDDADTDNTRVYEEKSEQKQEEMDIDEDTDHKQLYEEKSEEQEQKEMDEDTDNRRLDKEKPEEQEQKEMNTDNHNVDKSEEQEHADAVVDEGDTDHRLLFIEKLELEVYIQTQQRLNNITCKNEAEYRGKLDVLIKKQNEFEAMDWKQKELMPIILQINQRFLDSINTTKAKLNQ